MGGSTHMHMFHFLIMTESICGESHFKWGWAGRLYFIYRVRVMVRSPILKAFFKWGSSCESIVSEHALLGRKTIFHPSLKLSALPVPITRSRVHWHVHKSILSEEENKGDKGRKTIFHPSLSLKFRGFRRVKQFSRAAHTEISLSDPFRPCISPYRSKR